MFVLLVDLEDYAGLVFIRGDALGVVFNGLHRRPVNFKQVKLKHDLVHVVGVVNVRVQVIWAATDGFDVVQEVGTMCKSIFKVTMKPHLLN